MIVQKRRDDVNRAEGECGRERKVVCRYSLTASSIPPQIDCQARQSGTSCFPCCIGKNVSNEQLPVPKNTNRPNTKNNENVKKKKEASFARALTIIAISEVSMDCPHFD
jgi:hypothetical protein